MGPAVEALGASGEEKEVKDLLNLIKQMTTQVIKKTIKMIKAGVTHNKMVTPAVEEEEAEALEAIDQDTLEEEDSDPKSR